MNQIFQTLDEEIGRLRQRVAELEVMLSHARDGCEQGYHNEQELQKKIEVREEQMRRTCEKLKDAHRQWTALKDSDHHIDWGLLGKDEYNWLDHLEYLTSGPGPKDRW